MSRGRPDQPFGERWRESTWREQEAALPSGRVVASCTARLGAGGLGRHLGEIVDALERGRRPTTCISGSTRESASSDARRAPRHPFGIPYLGSLLPRLRLLPTTPGLRTRAFMLEFDAYAAQRLPAADHLIAFNGQALKQMRVAGEKHYQSLTLVSANSHLKRVARQHARSLRQYPLERSWTTRLVERNCAEYARADRIYVASRYIRESFLEEGFSEEVMTDFPLTPDPRYERDQLRTHSSSFDIVYVGSLNVHKGVPLLIDAVRRLAHADIRLVLVGGWTTPGVRRFIRSACADDSRISVRPGDPLTHLRSARLCAHPAYEDGFGYAPAEALACGVPVIVSEDTGMKELIDPGRDGLILPTGDLGALTEAIDAAYGGELLTPPGDAANGA